MDQLNPLPKLVRITTVPISHRVLLKGQHGFMREHGFEVIAVSTGGTELKDVGREEGVRIFPITMTRSITPFRDLISLWRFYRFCKNERPAIVHSHTPKAGIIGMLGAKLAGVPMRLHTVAGLPLMEATGMKRKVLDFVERMTYNAATKVYPNSKKLADFILENKYTTHDKVKVIANGSSNGINTTHFSPNQVTVLEKQDLKAKLNIQINDFVFVFVGRLVGDKGINELIKAFKSLSSMDLKQVPKLLLVGSLETDLDPLHAETLEAINENEAIISVGFQQDVRPYFAIADCLAFPSYREGFPNVVMQAGAMGLPSVVSDINGCNEIVIEGENGMIIPVKDATVLKDAMLRMVEDVEFYKKLKANARHLITSRFEQELVWDAILEEYFEVGTEV